MGVVFQTTPTASHNPSQKENAMTRIPDINALLAPLFAEIVSLAMIPMVGAVILAIALTDHLIHVIVKHDHRITRDLVDQSHGE